MIVHLYEEYGDRCVDHLRGMFAFALWDRTKRRLLVARDRLGKKPLFYRATPDAFWFGSEPKSILQDPEVPRDVNHDAIDAFLQLQYVPRESGPRCSMTSHMRASSASSTGPRRSSFPAIPHMSERG